MPGFTRGEIERILSESLAHPLVPDDLEEMVERVGFLAEDQEVLRAAALHPGEPVFYPTLQPRPERPLPPAQAQPLPEREAPLAELSLLELSHAIRRGTVSPVEVTEACLREIEGRDPALNSFITVTADQALEEARGLTEELAQGRYRGPLHGVPIGLKDLLMTTGVRTTAGSRILGEWVPDRDATVIRLLRNAGAVSLGKLNMHEFAFGATGENAHYGGSRNPHDLSRITGGSSSGSGAAVAGKLCYGTVGSDTGGSIRCPAALCGIVGLKPTYGRISRDGVLPLAWSLDHLGPMTRTVADAAIFLEAMSGYDPADPTSARQPVPAYGKEVEGGVRGLRLGIPREFFWDVIQPGVELRVREAIEVLRAEGAEIREFSLTCMDLASPAQSAVICSEATAYHRASMRTRSAEYGRGVLKRLALGLFYSAGDYIDAQRARRQVTDELLGHLREVDAILTPAVPITAPAPDEWIPAGEVLAPAQYYMVRNTYLFNHTGQPAISVPCGTADGLPVGLQIAGRPWEEGLLLRIARVVERNT